ncbi:hypothetical protein LCGC14_1470150 [marine sediment metagenome]|uniref:Uncharacterized protein n=1 Tax=marine sediment metagenome TaxID=412755 RepID=A0A0F9MEC3_9ZZZZ
MKTDKELIEIWNNCEENRRMNMKAEAIFELLPGEEKLRIFDLIKEGKHLN